MAMTTIQRRRQRQLLGIFWTIIMQAVVIYDRIRRQNHALPREPHRDGSDRQSILDRMFGSSDRVCHENLRMNIGTFHKLCSRLRAYGLVDSRSLQVEEQVAIFLNTVGYDQRNRSQTSGFIRSGQTVSLYFHKVLDACLGLYKDVVKNATVHYSPYEKGNAKPWYTYFQDAVGAIDGTHIAARVFLEDQARYRNRKQVISQNVLVACTFDMKFTYVFAGWEGSAHDGRLLRSVILREGHKLTVPIGKYYLADAGFPSIPGFLVPHRKTRYHRRDIDGQRHENPQELFNFRHSSLRNVVERTIGLLKRRFAYLRHQPYHGIKTQANIVLACCAIHNFLRIEDEEDVCDEDREDGDEVDNDIKDETPNAHISFATDPTWSDKRNAIAELMWADYN